MKLLVPALLVLSFCLVLVGCGPGSGNADDERIAVDPKSGGHQEACKILLTYADRVEQIYLQYEWVEMEKRLVEAEADYRSQMSKLADAGKWTPRQNISKSLKLPFLIGRFHGALHSCKIENMRDDTTLVGCQQVRSLKDAMEKLCFE